MPVKMESGKENTAICGTIPTSNTVLWFEFLVHPNLLIPHLEKIKPDPSPAELITKFLMVYHNSEIQTEIDPMKEQPKLPLRCIALKILALKIAAYLKWDLKVFQAKLPLQIQTRLLEDLIYIASNKILRIGRHTLSLNIINASEETFFAATLWHRWIITIVVFRGTQSKNPRQPFVHLPTTPENNYIHANLNDDRFVQSLECEQSESLNFLKNVIDSDRVPKIFIPESFIALTDTTTEVKQNWDAFKTTTKEEFHCQLHYDIGCFYFYHSSWAESKKHFIKCMELYNNLPDPGNMNYGNFQIGELKGFLFACGEFTNGHQTSLLYKFNVSVENGFVGTTNIMLQDNIERVIPLVHRQLMEVETIGALVCDKYYVAKDILVQFASLNVIRQVLDGSVACLGDLIHFILMKREKPLDILLSTAQHALMNGTNEDRMRIKTFLLNLVDIPDFGTKIEKQFKTHTKKIFNENELRLLTESGKMKSVDLPSFLKTSDWQKPKKLHTDTENNAFEMKVLEKKIIACYDIKRLWVLLTEWNKKSSKPIWRINNNWKLPIPLSSGVMSLEDTNVQSLAYVLLAKGRELMLANDFKLSLKMYSQFDTEKFRAKPANAKLWKLVCWEILLVKVMEYTEHWPANYMPQSEKQELIDKCKKCLSTQQGDCSGSNVIPRTEIVEHLSLFLLNIGEWDYLTSLEKRWNYFELTTAVTHACQDLMKSKGSKKLHKDAWDLILPVFGPSSSQLKRGNSTNSTNIMHRDSPTSKTKLNIITFMSNLRNEYALSVVISLLARLYNVLKDESNLELHIDYITLWPAVVSNANSYNSKNVSEVLWQVVETALTYYPNNVSWLKMMGDIDFCNDYPEAALKSYIKSVIVATEYFTLPIAKPLIDDHTIKRMIKCCTEMHCYTQAAVLCQFLEEVDYTLAFHCLGEMKPGNCFDAMDAYYNCIWDVTILEYLINLHHKRGEEHRKREAIRIIGLLELNSNNNEEIKREAANMRKAKFMRAMVTQYVNKYPI